MFILIALFITGICVSAMKLFERHCLDHFTAKAELDHKRSDINKPFDILLEMENDKWMILPFIKINVSLPANIAFADEAASSFPSSNSYMTYLLMHQKSFRRISLHGDKRGLYLINITIELSDLLGFVHKTMEADSLNIMIHPEHKEFSSLKNDSGIDGEILTQRWLHPDPIFFTGVRPYTYNEPFKDIHWKSSAKMNSLQVKNHDTSSNFHVVMCLLTENNASLFSDDPEFFEEAIRYCAYFLNEAWKKQVPCGFITNAYSKIPFHSVFRADYALNHLTRCFDILSCIQPMQSYDSTTVYHNSVLFTESGNEVYYFINKVNDKLVNALYACLRKAIKVTVFIYDTSDVKLPSGVTVIHMKEAL